MKSSTNRRRRSASNGGAPLLNAHIHTLVFDHRRARATARPHYKKIILILTPSPLRSKGEANAVGMEIKKDSSQMVLTFRRSELQKQ